LTLTKNVNRKHLDKAWQKYMRIEYYDETPNKEVGKVVLVKSN
jgi:hypothetical protein